MDGVWICLDGVGIFRQEQWSQNILESFLAAHGITLGIHMLWFCVFPVVCLGDDHRQLAGTKDDTISLRSKVSDKHVSLENSSSDTWQVWDVGISGHSPHWGP